MGWLQLIVPAVGLLPNAGFLIEMISAAIDDCIALSHGAIDRVEIVTLVSAPALDHVALCIVTDPLTGTIGPISPLASFGFLIDILAGGFLALVNGVQPVPSVGSRVIDFLAAAIQALANALFVPEVSAFDGQPLAVRAIPVYSSNAQGTPSMSPVPLAIAPVIRSK